MHPARDHHLPPDPDAYRHAPHPTGRVIVIAPTRAACETIELALGLHLDTLLERSTARRSASSPRRARASASSPGTARARRSPSGRSPKRSSATPLRVGVVNREREATPETPSWNVDHRHDRASRGGGSRTTGHPAATRSSSTRSTRRRRSSSCASRWGSASGCRFIWLSAPRWTRRSTPATSTAPTCWRAYAFDPAQGEGEGRAAEARRVPERALHPPFIKQKRGRRACSSRRAPGSSEAAGTCGEQWPRIPRAFYHGGEPIRVIRPFLEGEAERPFLLAMTAAGQSALNVRGLDTVVIDDARYGNVVERGRNVLHRLYLGANEILQMAGRVHGRVPDGEVVHPERPRPRLRARSGPRRPSSSSPATPSGWRSPAPRWAWTRETWTCRWRSTGPPTGARSELLTSRGMVEDGRLTRYGREVEAMPVERALGRAPGARRRRAAADGGRVLQHRLTAPHDARGARSARRRRQRAATTSRPTTSTPKR